MFRQVDGRSRDEGLSNGFCGHTGVGTNFGVLLRVAGRDGGCISLNDRMARGSDLGRSTEACLKVGQQLGGAHGTGSKSVLFSQDETMVYLSRASRDDEEEKQELEEHGGRGTL